MKLVLFVICLLGFLWIVARLIEHSRVYHPVRDYLVRPDTAMIKYESVTLVTDDDKRLASWWCPAENARGTMIVCHGNAGNMSDCIEGAELFLSMSLNVLLFDYRGYGESRGWPTEKGLYSDVQSAYEYVLVRHEHMHESLPVLVYGRSLGGAVALHLAAQNELQGIIIESTFTSLPDMAKQLYPSLPGWLCSQQYKNIDMIGQIDAPLLLSHSPADDLVPFSMGQKLFNAAPPDKKFVTLNGSHAAHGWTDTPSYKDALRRFVQTITTSQ